MTEDDITLVTAWLVVAAYVVSVVLEIRQFSSRAQKVSWTAGAILLSIHIAWAMFAIHDGSLAAAYRHTAQQTERQIGVAFGGGLVVNLAMLSLWWIDVALWWLLPAWAQVRRKISTYLHAFFAFLFFNATIVFGAAVGHTIGIAAVLCIVGVWLGSRHFNGTQSQRE
jgi:hypothetical protein